MTNAHPTPARAPRRQAAQASRCATSAQPGRGSASDPGALEYDSWLQQLQARANQGPAPRGSNTTARATS